MNNYELVVTAVAVIVITGGGGIWLARGRRARRERGEAGAGPKRRKMTAAEEEAAVNRVKTAVGELLQTVAGNIRSLQGDTSQYGRVLEEHRQELQRTVTVEELRDLEERLLTQVETVEAANNEYRRQLDAAKSKVRDQQEELDRLQTDVGVDFLTELPNRRRFEEKMTEMMSRADRYGNTFSLVIFDIDRFKDVNDTYGHAAGDRVLRAIAQMLNEHRRASDFLARYGGEEFLLILPETSLENARRRAELARERIEKSEFTYQQQHVKVTISAGVGQMVPGVDTGESLFERVDKALYHAKNEGRNRVCVSESPQPRGRKD